MNFENLPTKELVTYTEEILKTYKKALFDCNTIKDINKKYFLKLKSDGVYTLSAEQYKSAIENILNDMDEEESNILKELYIKRSKNPLWYLSYCSRSTFYRNKRKALEDFLFYFLS